MRTRRAQPLRPVNEKLWGCGWNEERSNTSTGHQTCTGELNYRTGEVAGFKTRYYICDKHEAEKLADEEDSA